MELKEIQNKVYDTAIKHGWEDQYVEVMSNSLYKTLYLLSKIDLVHSELGQASEAIRNHYQKDFYQPKEDGLTMELADATIRILNLCSLLDIDLEEAILKRNDFNVTRPFKHGGKKF